MPTDLANIPFYRIKYLTPTSLLNLRHTEYKNYYMKFKIFHRRMTNSGQTRQKSFSRTHKKL